MEYDTIETLVSTIEQLSQNLAKREAEIELICTKFGVSRLWETWERAAAALNDEAKAHKELAAANKANAELRDALDEANARVEAAKADGSRHLEAEFAEKSEFMRRCQDLEKERDGWRAACMKPEPWPYANDPVVVDVRSTGSPSPHPNTSICTDGVEVIDDGSPF